MKESFVFGNNYDDEFNNLNINRMWQLRINLEYPNICYSLNYSGSIHRGLKENVVLLHDNTWLHTVITTQNKQFWNSVGLCYRTVVVSSL